jgi:hypothetical protein
MCDFLKTLVSTAQFGGVLVAISALWWQIRRARVSTNVELVLKFDDKFNREDFRRIRSIAARQFRGSQSADSAEDVFDFFETLGYLVRTGAIEKELAWHTFYEWVRGYWSVGLQHIQTKRQERKDPALWADFEYLHKVLLKVQRKTSSGDPELLTTAEIDKFLTDETNGG